MAQTWAAVVVAAGRGERFGGPKQFVELAGLPMAGWSLRTFAELREVAALIAVTETEWLEPMRDLLARLAPERERTAVAGGRSRQESVANGLRAVPANCTAVLVHDGARPLVRSRDVRAAMAEVRAGRAALLAAPVVDTVKVVAPGARVVRETLDRRMLWAAQTPQLATTADLTRAHDVARRDGIGATDDATLLEWIGVEVVVVEASGENFKVTHPGDAARAEAILRERRAARSA